MYNLVSLNDVCSTIFDYKNRKVVPSQDYARFCSKELRLVNRAVQTLTTKNRLISGRDYFKIFENMIQNEDHEMKNYVDPRYGGIFLTRKAVNTISHYFDDINSVTLSNEVNELATEKQKTRDYKDPVLASLRQIMILREDQLDMEEKQKIHDEKISLLERKVKDMDGDTGYRSVVGFSRGVGVSVDQRLSQQVGRNATRKCKEMNLRTGKVPDEKWGEVKSYPIEVLNEVFKEMGLISDS